MITHTEETPFDEKIAEVEKYENQVRVSINKQTECRVSIQLECQLNSIFLFVMHNDNVHKAEHVEN
jgi:hypothetical protein